MPKDGGFVSHGGIIHFNIYSNRIYHSKPSSYWATSIYGTPQMVILPSGAVTQARANGQNLRARHYRLPTMFFGKLVNQYGEKNVAGWNILIS